ncbi:MAG: hypothetical protein Q8936_08700 [Bacillota bacterium]|nr:hypothetical protein [Bacillota bacterium]
MKNTGASSGYSKAFQLLLNKVGIRSIEINNTNNNYCWNIVTLDGQAYHTDVSYDVLNSRKDKISYECFNLSDSTLKNKNSMFTWDTLKYLKCTSTKFEYLSTAYNVFRVGATFYYNYGQEGVLSTYNRVKPSYYYEPDKDLNSDGIIDIYDIVKLSKEIK